MSTDVQPPTMVTSDEPMITPRSRDKGVFATFGMAIFYAMVESAANSLCSLTGSPEGTLFDRRIAALRDSR
jgi:hypothetical protein